MGKPAKPTPYSYSGDRFDNVLDGSSLDPSIQARGLQISGNGGNDTLKGGSGQDTLSGGEGNDYLFASREDLVGISAGANVYDGGGGSDTLDLSGIAYAPGTGTYVQLVGGAKGSNWIETDITFPHHTMDTSPVPYSSQYKNNFSGIENFVLGDGNDLIQLLGATGNNRIVAGGGDDHILAGDGADFVDGGAGDDLISGGWGSDVMTGGSGSDEFVWQGRLASEYTQDRITDFNPSEDKLALWSNWTVDWDENSPNLLHAYLMENGVVWGEITFDGMTLADAPNVVILGIDSVSGDLI